jgi:hypothetical protein
MDDNNDPFWPTWAEGALSGVRDVFTSTVYNMLTRCTYPSFVVIAAHPRQGARGTMSNLAISRQSG